MTPQRRIPEEWRENYLHVERSNTQLRKDLVTAFDRIHSLELKYERAKTRAWVMGATMAAEGALIYWLATSLVQCIQVHSVGLLH